MTKMMMIMMMMIERYDNNKRNNKKKNLEIYVHFMSLELFKDHSIDKAKRFADLFESN